MPRDSPHSRALFSLVPLNERAERVLKHPHNAHHISQIPSTKEHALRGLDIGFHIASESRHTLATIGRVGDIIVEGQKVSRIQCSFEISDGKEHEVMLQDRSSNRTTKFFGHTAQSFEPDRPHRRVVIDRRVNLQLGFGGKDCDLYQFKIVWHDRNLNIRELLNCRGEHPCQALTVLDYEPTAAPSGPVARMRAPGTTPRFRYIKRELLGRGAFGEVYKATDVDTGNPCAVKIVRRPTLQSYSWAAVQREVETLSRISHRNIIDYKAYHFDDVKMEIVMGLKDGNVEGLIQQQVFTRNESLVNPFLHQMLQALDYLTFNGIIHRDVKPANILYTPVPSGGYEYYLADFGLANAVDDAQTFVGTSVYMAPELQAGVQQPQTTKMDVWSLFVTLAYALNAAGFRGKPLHTVRQRITAAQEAAMTTMLQPLKGMAEADPLKRASAAQMLDEVFHRDGRTTALDRISTAATGSDGTIQQRLQPLRQAAQGERSVPMMEPTRGAAEGKQQRQTARQRQRLRQRRETTIAASLGQAEREPLPPQSPEEPVDTIPKAAGKKFPKPPGAYPTSTSTRDGG